MVDTNKLLAAILKAGKTRRLLILAPADFFALKYAIEEIEKHRNEICKRVGLDETSFNYLLYNVILPELKLVDITDRDALDEANE